MKFRAVGGHRVAVSVAPHWGAWIEIRSNTLDGDAIPRSHPTGVRGLKYDTVCVHVMLPQSHPTGVRGLKSFQDALDTYRCARRTPLGCVD